MAISRNCIPTNVISFHYVSQRESLLLYQYIHKQNKSLDIPLNAEALAKAWPSKNTEVGHYSRPIRSQSEAQLLYAAIFKEIQVASC